MSEDEKKAMFEELIGKCKASEGASDNDIQQAIAHAPPTTPQGQCFHACIMESVGIVWKFNETF